MTPLFPIRLKKGVDDAVRGGAPWVYASDIIDSSQGLLYPHGSLVAIENAKGQAIGTGYYNSKSQISCRVLALGKEAVDEAFFTRRFERAMGLRDALVGVPYYRMVHSEADGLPGLLVDRFGDTLVVQVGTAGMELLQPLWLPALDALLKPTGIVLRNDVAARTLEGLAKSVSWLKGANAGLYEVVENGCVYFADLERGQKTGWFFDQRDNRKMIAEMSKGKTLVDVFSHSGGFGVIAAKMGARAVTMVDSSALALSLATKAAQRNDVANLCVTVQGDAFEVMDRLRQDGKRYEVVLADPPAFVKTKKDIAAGMRGYLKVARMAAGLVEPGGLLFVASCSHHAIRPAFNKAVLEGVAKARREAVLLKQTGAAGDHPKHPALPQNEYLKGILLKIA